MIGLHPGKKTLLVYAESLADEQGRSTVQVDVARHVSSCERCRRRVDEMRQTFASAAAAEAIEPSAQAYAEILQAARRERAIRRQGSPAGRGRGIAVRMGYAAAVVLTAALSFGTALQLDAPEPGNANAPDEALSAASDSAAKGPSQEEMARAASYIRELAPALERSGEPGSVQEMRLRRTLSALEADLSVALTELERNPGSERLNRVFNSNLQRQARALREYYKERAL
jgi:hypothetical protein